MTDKEQKNSVVGTGYQAENMTVNNETHVHSSTFKNKSVIAQVVNIISRLPRTETEGFDSASLSAGVVEKIEHNNISRSRHIIQTYKNNVIDFENVYKILEQERPGAMQKVLERVRFYYRQQLEKLAPSDSIDNIRRISDTLLENVRGILRDKVLESSNLDAENEDVDLAVNLIVADAFKRCLVLENPETAV